MRNLVFILPVLLLSLCGCKHAQPVAVDEPFSAVPGVEAPVTPVRVKPVPVKPVAQKPVATRTVQAEKLIITPGETTFGKVVSVNEAARFVVLSFPLGHLPPMDQHLGVYRHGLKIGEVKITGPQSDENIIANVETGDPVLGDEVKTK
jgi:hypothetical protein